MSPRKYLAVPLALFLLAATDGARYDSCVALTKKQPQLAYDQASGWRADRGGAAAMHCQALALLELGQPVRAATVLDAAAEAMEGTPFIAADMHAQAGNAWLLAGDAKRATARFTWALDLLPAALPSRADVLIDRARAYASLEDKSKTIADLAAALTLAPKNIEALLLRAEAYLSMGDKTRALSDIATARSLPMDADDKVVWEKLNIRAAK